MGCSLLSVPLCFSQSSVSSGSTVGIQSNRRPTFWLDPTSFVMTVHVGICTYDFGDTSHRQQCRMEKEALVSFRQNMSGSSLPSQPCRDMGRQRGCSCACRAGRCQARPCGLDAYGWVKLWPWSSERPQSQVNSIQKYGCPKCPTLPVQFGYKLGFPQPCSVK